MTRCNLCNGSGYLQGTWSDILCPDCMGEGMWDDEAPVVRRAKYVPSPEYLAWKAEQDARRTLALVELSRRSA